MNPDIVVCIVLIILSIAALAIIIPSCIVHAKYKNFLLKHSISLKRLETINKGYSFNVIRNFDQFNSYDNESFYGNISPRDYLIYKLTYIKNQVKMTIDDAEENRHKYDEYEKEIAEKCVPGMFDTTENVPPNNKRLLRMEKKYILRNALYPTVNFSILVGLELTNINGAHRASKRARFHAPEILTLIKEVNKKQGYYYTVPEIWDAICRVERGKVTNRMRFAIYQRDGWRCKKCGRKNKYLEIDHIVPIAKGGKSTYDNLQTLCHSCNKKKGTNIEDYTSRTRRY